MSKFTCIEDVLPSLLKSPKVAIDIGARKGGEINLLKRTYPSFEQIHVFEPLPKWEKRLNRIFGLYQWFHFYPMAVSDKDGEADFYVDARKGDSSSLREPDREKFSGRRHFPNKIVVKTCKLDTWYLFSKIDVIDFIWTDIQGSEGELIRGATEALKKTKYLYLEYCQNEWYKGQTLLDELIFNLVDDFELINIFPYFENGDGAGDVLFKNKNNELF